MIKIAGLIALITMSFIGGGLYLSSFDSEPMNFFEDPLHREFQTWKQTYNKAYESHEHSSRFAIFKQNYDLIQEHNQGNHSYGLAANQYMDLTFEEFTLLKTGGVPQKPNHAPTATPFTEEPLLEAIDWRERGAVTPVKK